MINHIADHIIHAHMLLQVAAVCASVGEPALSSDVSLKMPRQTMAGPRQTMAGPRQHLEPSSSQKASGPFTKLNWQVGLGKRERDGRSSVRS